MKKFFIKICKLFGFEIIDQNKFYSPTLGKELNEDLSTLNKESIVLPLGKVNITKSVKSILIILRDQIWYMLIHYLLVLVLKKQKIFSKK